MKRLLLLLTLSLLSQMGFAAIRLDGNQSSTPETGYENGHEWVDLGLPSGTLWASCNMGASSPEEYGDYFSWGETSPKAEYSFSTLKYFVDKGDGGFDKYVTSSKSEYWYGNGLPDNKTMLELSDDAACANWGGNWRTPTEFQWDELIYQCTWLWLGNGYKVIGPNGHSIILPAAGARDDSSSVHEGSFGYYWSSSLDSSPHATIVMFSKIHGITSTNRCEGLPIRPVTE